MDYNSVHNLFDYDYVNGGLIWRVDYGFYGYVGDYAAWINECGYKYIKLKDKLSYTEHRLVWLWHHKRFPVGGKEIDHINRDRADNRIENLREVTHRENCENTVNRTDNTSGVRGVHFSNKDNSWHARIMTNGTHKHIHWSRCFDEAVLHRLAAEQCLGWINHETTSPAYQYALKHGLIFGGRLDGESVR